MTNWVTIKVPERTRDKAQEDPRTYEEIMKAGLKPEQADPESEVEVSPVDHLQLEAIDAVREDISPEQIAREVWRQADEAMLERVVRNVLQSELGGRT